MTEAEQIPIGISVHLPGGRTVTEHSALRLERLEDPEASIEIQLDERSRRHVAGVPQGRYRVVGELRESELSGWELPPVTFRAELQEGENEMLLAIYVRQPGWLTFRYGDSWLSIEPRENVAVAFEHDAPSELRAGTILSRLAEFGLEPMDPSPRSQRSPFPHRLAGGSILIFSNRNDDFDPVALERVLNEVQLSDGVSEPTSRVGVAVDLAPFDRAGRGIAVLDRRAFVGLRADRDEAVEPHTWFDERLDAGSEAADGLEEVWSLEMDGRDPFADLARLAALEDRESQVVDYAEPDLIVQLVDCQENLELQTVPEAWDYLDKHGHEALGNGKEVSVTIFDHLFPLEKNGDSWRVLHRDAPEGQVSDFYDCRELATGDKPYEVSFQAPHGLTVYGVLGAWTANDIDIDGVAPEVEVVLAEHPNLASGKYYVQVLRWLAGDRKNRPGDSKYGPCPNPSKIICCAHSPGTEAPKTFAKWALEMRKQGVILIYAAGNEDGDLSAMNGYANNVNTLAIGNCEASDDGFTYVSNSNRGPRLDICAIGEGAWTLVKGGSLDISGGTSLAAATVTGAVALMRTKDPKIDFHGVRDRLRETAQKNADPNADWSRSGRSHRYGSGLLDTAAAVESV